MTDLFDLFDGPTKVLCDEHVKVQTALLMMSVLWSASKVVFETVSKQALFTSITAYIQ